MRIAATVALCMLTTSAHAERLYSPVYVKQTTAACGDLASLKVRDNLLRQNRTEMLSGLNTMSVFTGECANAPAGQWMFFDQASGDYVCLRPRLGAECAWLPKSAVGEIVELTVSTRSPNCPALSSAADKSKKYEAELTSRWRAEQPKSRAEDFARGMLGDMLGMVTGVPGGRVDHAKNCLYYSVSAQEKARRVLIYQACPSLGNAGQERQNFSALNKIISDTCAPHLE
ncbi:MULTISPECIES: hypothetical protein [unclassified Bradyrhizobium]|uniref:hypothetical protein n=1 Tax=unclassified Bradyrhizobium TaxID=2631580 RepID=UPI002916D101|nr:MULTISPECIES: hypothetical protein [unclassified Bradyrhizobium]